MHYVIPKSNVLLFAWICFSFYVNYLLLRGEEECSDNAIADVLVQSCL